MKTILFINGCVRGKNSRTLNIAKTYINKLKSHEDFVLIEKNLIDENLSFMTDKSFNPENGEQLDQSTALSKEFAMADEIILAAPYWEFMFPAVVSCYIEQVSRVGVTFKYTETGSQGLCKARSFTYIYTAGDYLKAEDKVSEKYLNKLTKLYGIPSFSAILADGLDIQTNDAEKLVLEACDKIKNNRI